MIALWKQELRNPAATAPDRPRATFLEAWRDFVAGRRPGRLLLAVGLGTAGFSMQDILLEPYGGEVLGLRVGATTGLTALLAGGSLAGLALAARALGRHTEPHRLSGFGALVGILAFSAVIFSAPLESATLFRIGTALIGFGAGLFAVGTLTAAMALADGGQSGLALGAWGAVQATAAGTAVALGGVVRDLVDTLAANGLLGGAMSGPASGYGVVYHIEVLLLFAAIVAIGPLVRPAGEVGRARPMKFGLAELPS